MASSLPTSHSMDITGATVADNHSLAGILPEIGRSEPRASSVNLDTRKGSTASLVPSRLDAFYDAFYSALSNFSFDKAKELVDKQQREFTIKHYQGIHGLASGGNPPVVAKATNWLLLMTSLSHLSAAERNYTNLTFLAPKGFLRKENNLKSSLTLIKNDLKKLMEPVLEEHILLREEIFRQVGLRLDLMDFYEKLSLLGTAKNVEIVDLLSDIEPIVDKYNEEKRSTRLPTQAFYKSLGWEIESVESLLKAHGYIQDWKFLPSLIAIQETSRILTEWNSYMQLKEAVKKASFYNFPPALPALYQWIWRLRAALLSKFSLYFYEILSKNSNEQHNIRTFCTKLQTDLYSKLASFQKKSDALSVCLVLDSRGASFHASGYQHPLRPVKSPEGIESFPAILAIPSKPTSHWPSVVMIISDKMSDLMMDKFIGVYDTSVQATYFVMRMDAKIYMLAVYETKKSEKDSYTMKAMQEFAVELKCGKIFSALKQGVK